MSVLEDSTDEVVRTVLSTLPHRGFQVSIDRNPCVPGILNVHVFDISDPSPDVEPKTTSFTINLRELFENFTPFNVVDVLRPKLESAIEELKSMK